jgi:serine/threonine-protein kinase RsbW
MTTQTPVRRSLTVPGRPEQAAAARQFAARALGPRHPHAETAVLLVSELVTNSLRHSASSGDGGTITITVITGPGELVRVEVTDDGAATVPMVQPACGEDEGGRGMQLVSALASAWNCRREGSRTTTWFELAPRPQRAGGRVGVAGLNGGLSLASAGAPGASGGAAPAGAAGDLA